MALARNCWLALSCGEAGVVSASKAHTSMAAGAVGQRLTHEDSPIRTDPNAQLELSIMVPAFGGRHAACSTRCRRQRLVMELRRRRDRVAWSSARPFARPPGLWM